MNPSETAFAAALRLQHSGTPYALVSVVQALAPASARPGDKAVVTADGELRGWVGGGCAQPAVVRTVRQALADGRARLIRIGPAEPGQDAAVSPVSPDRAEGAAPVVPGSRDLGEVLEFGMACHSGGTLELFVDPVLPRAQLVVIGNSPVAASLVQLAPRVGFSVTLVAQGALADEHPDAERVIAQDDLAAALPQIAPGAWVVVATQGRRDVQALRLALALGARQVAFVASARKAQVLKQSLVAAGSDAAAVDAIVAPAGYPMSATTPEEIALSVLAAVVSHRRGAIAAPAAQLLPAAAQTVDDVSPTSASTCCSAPSRAQPLPASVVAATPVKVQSCCGGLG